MRHRKKVLEMCQKLQCIQALLYLYQQTNTLVDTLPEEQIPF